MKLILIVDDKPELARIVTLYLSSSFHVMYKENPIKAISWLNEGNIPDGIISDINMPEMNGEEFLRYLKNNELFNQIPVIMLSSEDSSSTRIRLLEGGAEDYMMKPFNPEELKIKLRKFIK